MSKLSAFAGFACGIFAGVVLLLQNPAVEKSFRVDQAETYEWSALEFFGNAFEPENILRIPGNSVYRPLGAGDIELGSAAVLLLTDETGQPRALAVRLATISQSGDMLRGNVGIDTYTNIFWPNTGSIFLQGYENRWPLIKGEAPSSMGGTAVDGMTAEYSVSAISPDKAFAGIVGGSGQFRSSAGRYSETLWRDPDQPDLYAGTISLERSAR